MEHETFAIVKQIIKSEGRTDEAQYIKFHHNKLYRIFITANKRKDLKDILRNTGEDFKLVKLGINRKNGVRYNIQSIFKNDKS